MKKKIKQTKVIIILTIAIVVVSVIAIIFIVKDYNLKKSLSLKTKCQNAGEKLYQMDLKNNKESGNLCEPKYTYNKELNTCIYFCCYISLTNSDQIYTEDWIKDALTNEKIISFITFDDKPFTFGCPTCASSREEFDRKREELFNQ